MFTRSSPLPSSSPESHRVSLLKRRIPLLNGLKIEDIRKRLRIISEYKNNQKLCLNGSTDKVYDDYGFVIDNYSAYENPFSVQRKRKDHEDFEKWLPIFRKWKDDKPSNDVSEAVYSGVPNAVRDYLWPRLLRVKFVRKQGSTSTYRELLVRAKKLSPFLGQIDLDVMRTFTTHRDFEKRHGNMQNSLFNILVAYSMYNTDLGYTQGMNNIAALFLMYMGEEAAFWALHSVMTDRKYTMHGLFVEGFPKLYRIDVHIRRCLIKYLPELQLLTDQIPAFFVSQKVFCCFLRVLPFSLAVRVWDIFLLEGDSVLVAMILTIFRMNQERFKAFKIEDLLNYFQFEIEKEQGIAEESVIDFLRMYLQKLREDNFMLAPGDSQSGEYPVTPYGRCLTSSLFDINHEQALKMLGRNPVKVNG